MLFSVFCAKPSSHHCRPQSMPSLRRVRYPQRPASLYTLLVSPVGANFVRPQAPTPSLPLTAEILCRSLRFCAQKRGFPPQKHTVRRNCTAQATFPPPSSAPPCDTMSCSPLGKRYPAESAPQETLQRKERHEAREKVGGGCRAEPATLLVTFVVSQKSLALGAKPEKE